MGSLLSKLFSGKKEMRAIMIGLDASGKTTILYRLKLNESITTIPTVGFNVETIKYNNLNLNIWDIGGQDKIRPLWRHYYDNTNAIIYVIDSIDRERLKESSDELQKILKEPLLINAPLLIYTNKQDLPNPISVVELANIFELYAIRNRKWYIQSCSAITGDGIYEGLGWLSNTLNKI
jgi:ADP-ribosylation factor protein 1